MNVKQFYSKNQFLIENGTNYKLLQSYESQVAKIENGLLTLGNDWDYSQTTQKYVYKFISDYINYICDEQYNELYTLSEQTNKRQFLQKLINKNIINVQNDL